MKQSEIIKMAIQAFPMPGTIRIVAPYLNAPGRIVAAVANRKLIITHTFASMKENGRIIDPWRFKAIRTDNSDCPILWCYCDRTTKEAIA